MIPEEKAKDLINKFFIDNLLEWDLSYIQSKKCALIATNEVLETLYKYHYDSESGAYEYWSEIKIEIENL